MNCVSGIVENGKPQVVTWMDAKDKKRMDNLQEKVVNDTISKTEQIELCSRKVADALKNYSQSISFAGTKQNNEISNKAIVYAQDLSMEDMQNLIERKSKGLNEVMVKQIATLSAKQRELFFKKDNNGDYMIPTKVLNSFEKPTLKYEDTCLVITNKPFDWSSKIDNYVIDAGTLGYDIRINAIKIMKVDHGVALQTRSDGTYRAVSDTIFGSREEQGQTKDLN